MLYLQSFDLAKIIESDFTLLFADQKLSLQTGLQIYDLTSFDYCYSSREPQSDDSIIDKSFNSLRLSDFKPISYFIVTSDFFLQIHYFVQAR